MYVPPAAVDAVLAPQVPLPVDPEVALRTWKPLALKAVAIVVYLVFIFEFHRFVARRDIFKLRFIRIIVTVYRWFAETVRRTTGTDLQ
jgi:hypothetical protein